MTVPRQVYEAVVLDGAPDPELPGHISVKIPELYGDDEVPFLVPPLLPGWSGGGWHCVPQATTPDGDDSRVIIIALGTDTFRWLGTSQGWPEVLESAGGTAGARSASGDSWVKLVDGDGAEIAGNGGSRLFAAADGTVQVIGSLVELGSSPATHPFILSTSFMTDLMNAINDIVTGLAAVPYTAATATAFAAQIAASLGAGSPYLSTVVKGG